MFDNDGEEKPKEKVEVEIRGLDDLPPEIKEGLSGLLKHLNGSKGKGDRVRPNESNLACLDSTRQHALRLQELQANYATKHNFKPGQLIQWKSGQKNRKWPQYGEPAIVIEVMPSGLIDTTVDCSTPAFHEPLTIRVGIINPKDGEFGIYVFDGNRFEPYGG